MNIHAALGFLLVAISMATARAVDPIPEAQQAFLASKILNGYHHNATIGAPKKLHVVYFTPSDREPEPRYQERLEAILEDIRAFYRDGMQQSGFGPETFDFARDGDGRLLIHLVRGHEPESAYPRSKVFAQSSNEDWLTREKIRRESGRVLEATGISFQRDTVLVFCNLASWNETTRAFHHHSPFLGQWTDVNGSCFALDSVILNAADISKKAPIVHDAEWGDESLGKFNTIFIGGIAHELGHAFSLPHCGERWDEVRRGKSLMGYGNHTYREELRGEGPGAFLTMASAMKLTGRPLFRKADRDDSPAPRMEQEELRLSTDVTRRDLLSRSGALRVEGTVKGTPPIYGVIAYFDSARDGGYTAPSATSVPDSEGRFAIEISDLPATHDGEVRMEFCHANGAVSQDRAAYEVTPQGAVVALGTFSGILDPVCRAVSNADVNTARLELGRIEKGNASSLIKSIARNLVATLDNSPKQSPAELSPSIHQLFLGDARPSVAEVGWLKPSANRIPPNDEGQSPLLDAGTIYATGLFGHAPSRYTFDLGGKWQRLRGEAALHRAHQPYGSVAFIIKVDGKESFHSPVIRGAQKASYDVDVSSAKTLELVVDDGGDGRANDWGLWLGPTLYRNTQN